MLSLEQGLWDQEIARVAGVDEAGRGPLAGPVVAAAVVFPVGVRPEGPWAWLSGIRDSKTLSERCREDLFARLTESPEVDWGVGQSEPDEIDRVNILQATFLAFRRALDGLAARPGYVLFDGNQIPPAVPIPGEAVVRGDGRSLSIAAASILAKVTRDRVMTALEAKWPGFGFARHKGYPTREHLAALRERGPCAAHRRSFGPVRQTEWVFPDSAP